MNKSGNNDGLKINPSDENVYGEGDDESKTKNSASSSNSIVEEGEKKESSTGLRPYVRSKVPRLRWTPDLHRSFVQALEKLGGQERATPKLVLQLMNMKGLSIAHVKSHLQMYRSKNIDDQGQVINNSGHLLGSADHLSHNLWKHSMLQTVSSNFRYGDVSWSGHGNWMSRPYLADNMNFKRGASLSGSLAERISGGVGMNTRNGAFHMMSNNFTQEFQELGSLYHRESIELQTRSTILASSFPVQLLGRGGETTKCVKDSNILDTRWSINGEERSTVKRKTWDNDLDLNLSLGMKSRGEKSRKIIWEEEEVDSNLSLSLSSPSNKELCSMNPDMLSKLLKEDHDNTTYPKLVLDIEITYPAFISAKRGTF